MKYKLLLFSLIGFNLHAQQLNNFKYVVVSDQYDFQSEANRYNLNDLMIFELKKYGFTAFKNSQILPADMNTGNCNTLQLDVEKSGFLSTQLDFIFKDCNDQEVLRLDGSSKKKDYDKAYFDAVRKAMKSLKKLNYEYQPNQKKTPPAIINTDVDDIKKNAVADSVIKSQRKIADENLEVAYISKDKLYTMVETALGYDIYQNMKPVGDAKRGSNGCYLVTTDNFQGLGNKNGDLFVVEVFTDSGSSLIVFE